jgi:hypothetical protein
VVAEANICDTQNHRHTDTDSDVYRVASAIKLTFNILNFYDIFQSGRTLSVSYSYPLPIIFACKLFSLNTISYDTFGRTRGVFSKVFLGFRNFGYDFLGVGGDVEGDSADMHARKFPLTSMGGQAEGLACADPGARTPIGVSGNFPILLKRISLYSPNQICYY